MDAISAVGQIARMIKAESGVTAAGHKYINRKPDGKGGYHYTYENNHTVEHVAAGTSAARRRADGGYGYDKGRYYTVHDAAHEGKYHKYESYAETPAAQKKDVLRQHSDKFGVNAHEKKAEPKRRKAKIDPEGMDLNEAPKEGHIHITDIYDQARQVPATLHGNYAVHGDKGSWAVTHAPTGLRMNNAKTKSEATQYARHMRTHAPDALSTAKFGQTKFEGAHKDEVAQLANAHRSFVKKSFSGNGLYKSGDAIDALRAYCGKQV